jgi:16S rRNA (uracil1498-N3)-methyltransferase
LLLEERTSHYLVRVLRLRPGQPLVLFNGDGFDYAAEVGDPRCREIAVAARVPALTESSLSITLAQAVGKGDRMDYSLQKATELGVAAVQPLFTERTEVRLKGKRLQKRMQHWQGVVIAACEQCGRAVVPKLAEPLGLGDWLAEPGTGLRLALDPKAEQSLGAIEITTNKVSLMVGPEGGFSESETRLMKLAGITRVSLGPRILRTETAGPAAITLLQARAGDLA